MNPHRDQAEHNTRVWREGRFVSSYDNSTLLPAEAIVLARYREALTGRVLDVGCGAGRVLAYLVALGADAHGIDVSPEMVEHCRQRFPGVDVRVGDLASLASSTSGAYDCILLPDNLLDVFDDGQRRAVLVDVGALLAPDGLLIFSSHNLAGWDPPAGAGAGAGGGRTAKIASIARRLSKASLGRLASEVAHAPRSRSNRRRLGPLQYREPDHAVINDSAHGYGLLHYYIRRGDQERQLSELGYRTLEVLELSGSSVAAGAEGTDTSLYYVATPQR